MAWRIGGTRQRRVMVWTLCVGALVGALSFGRAQWRLGRQADAIRSQADQTAAQASTTDQDARVLRATWLRLSDDLSAATAQLTASQADRHVAESELAATDADRATRQVALDQLDADLASTERSASEAFNQARESDAVRASLTSCLNGVSQLLDQLSVGDKSGAIRTLESIRGPCAVVGVAVGG